jgi:hypothetical protein
VGRVSELVSQGELTRETIAGINGDDSRINGLSSGTAGRPQHSVRSQTLLPLSDGVVIPLPGTLQSGLVLVEESHRARD